MSSIRTHRLKEAMIIANEIMEHQNPQEWVTMKYFLKTIKNPFVSWSYYKKILLALGVPIIEEPIDQDIYIQDILKNTRLTDEQKGENIEFRKEFYKEKTIWFHRAKFGESVGISSNTLKQIQDGSKELLKFGFDDLIAINQAKTKQIKLVKNINQLQNEPKLIKLECRILEKGLCKRTEPIGAISQNKLNQIYLPHTQIKQILRIQGRNSDLAFLILDLMDAISIYKTCVIGALSEVQSVSIIDNLLIEMKQSRIEAREHTDRICGNLEDVKTQLKDKKEVISNTEDKGVIIVHYIDETGYTVPEDEFLIYLHGGKQSYWHNYYDKEDKYNVVYCFETISDHDKAIRIVKRELGIKSLKPKRHLFALKQEKLDSLGEWFGNWEEKNR
tara:strand:- start:117 stop:1280 length:1164 start_codon:yes stop_codon:yes gene_type:complete